MSKGPFESQDVMVAILSTELTVVSQHTGAV